MLYGGAFDEVFFSRSGPIGKWFNTVGSVRYADAFEIGELTKLHRELDVTAHELYRLYKSGKIDEAHDGLKTIEKHSDQFLSVLSKLEKRLA